MLYLKHDFYSNFNSGINSGDNELLSDMLVNELSEIIVYRNPDLLALLKRAGISTSKKVSDEKLVDIIIKNISDNETLVKGLAFLISQNNKSNDIVKEVEGKDGKKRRVAQGTRAATIPEIDMVASGLVGISDSFKYKPQLKKEFKISLMKVIKTKSKAVGDRERKIDENQNGKYWFMAFLVVGLGVGAYFYIKHKKKVAAEGALIDGGTPPVVEPPVVEPPVAPVVEPPVAPVVEPPVTPMVGTPPVETPQPNV